MVPDKFFFVSFGSRPASPRRSASNDPPTEPGDILNTSGRERRRKIDGTFPSETKSIDLIVDNWGNAQL